MFRGKNHVQPSGLLTGIGVLVHLASASVWACPYSIRDSAFVGADHSPAYRVSFLINDRTPDKERITEWVASGADAWLADTNIRADVLNIDRQDTQAIRESLGSAFPTEDKLPAMVLVGPDHDALLLSQSSGKFTLDTVMDTLASVVESPARQEIHQHVITSWCVALLIEGTDAARNEVARKAIEAAGEKITGTTTELGKVVTHGPQVVTISASDPQERILLWSLGLHSPASGPDAPRVAMVLGRAELRGPVLEGDEITEKKLFETFEMLGRSCSCTTSPTWLTGPAVPMQWDQADKNAIQDELGFDPNDPQAIDSIKGVFAGGPGSNGRRGALGYREIAFSSMADAPQPGITVEDLTPAKPSADVGAFLSPTAGEKKTPRPESSALGAAAIPVRTSRLVLGGLVATAVVAMAVITLVILRKKQHA